jgi:outer membrane protein, multidrug efflux system
MRKLTALPLAAALLAGCVLGPDYRRPQVDTPKTYLYEPAAVQTVNAEWWKQFGDPVLDQLIAEALANNKSVKIAAANVEQAAAILVQTRSSLFPQVSYQGAAGRARSSQNSAIPIPGGVANPSNSYQLLGGVSWEIDLWGRVRRLSEAAQANLLATDEARRGVILSLVAQVAVSYLQLRGLDEQLEISQRTLKTYGDSLDLFKLQFQYGQTSQLTVTQSQSQYETAAAQIPQIRTQITVTENALSVLLGRNPDHIPRGKSILAIVLPSVPEGVPSELLERRPDLLQAEQQLVAANAQIGAARALYFPSISLTSAAGASSAKLDNLFKGPSKLWNFAGSVTGPIFTAGAISGQVAQAEAAKEAALVNYELAIQTAFADVENALSSRQELGEQLAAQERLVKALQEYSELARVLFDGGYESYTTVLQAEQQLFPEELNLAATRAQLFGSLASIYLAMGGGWVDTADKMTATGNNTPAR